jgi:hypothetical protein
MFNLNKGKVDWSVNNIIFAPEESANRELKKFIEGNPKSVRMSPQGGEDQAGPTGNVPNDEIVKSGFPVDPVDEVTGERVKQTHPAGS